MTFAFEHIGIVSVHVQSSCTLDLFYTAKNDTLRARGVCSRTPHSVLYVHSMTCRSSELFAAYFNLSVKQNQVVKGSYAAVGC